LRGAAGAARQLAALADFQFDVVDGAADRDVPEGKRVARLDRASAPERISSPAFTPFGARM